MGPVELSRQSPFELLLELYCAYDNECSDQLC